MKTVRGSSVFVKYFMQLVLFNIHRFGDRKSKLPHTLQNIMLTSPPFFSFQREGKK